MLQLRNGPESDTRRQDNLAVRLLIVDDEPDIRTPLARALSLQGYSVEEAASGHEALDLLEQTPPDLMVLDMNMPGLDGVTVMQRARQLHPELLIIILTGYATVDNAISALKLKAVDYLRKPVSTHEIVEVITRNLQKRFEQLRQEYLVQVLGETVDALRQPKIPPGSLPPPETSPPPSSVPLTIDSLDPIHVSPLYLDCQKRQVKVEDQPGDPIELTKGEMAVLITFMTQPNRVFSCQELVQAAWGHSSTSGEAQSIIRPYISRLRWKLETNPKIPRLIRTVRRQGYYLVIPPEV